MRPPDFLCIGTQRGGTTWLHRALDGHPNVWMPPFKELDYFAPEGPEGNRRDKLLWFHHTLGRQLRAGRHDAAALRWLSALVLDEPKDLAWYQRLFAPAGDRLTGDISPAYFRLNDAQIQNIHRDLPHLKIIIMLRHPVERADSQVGLMQQWKRWDESLTEPELVQRVTSPPFNSFGCYATVIERWERVFGRDNVFVFFHDNLKESPEETFEAIGAALGHPLRSEETTADLHLRVNGAKRAPRGAAYYSALAAYFLPHIEPLAGRWPDPVSRWCAELQALQRLHG